MGRVLSVYQRIDPQDGREWAVFRSRRMYQTDLQSELATAEDRGRVAGKQEGKLEIAQNALQMEMAIGNIVKLTGLTHDEVERLKN